VTQPPIDTTLETSDKDSKDSEPKIKPYQTSKRLLSSVERRYLELEKYLLQDWWSPIKAVILLAGFDPDRSPLTGDREIANPRLLIAGEMFCGTLEIWRILDIWEGSDHRSAEQRLTNGGIEYSSGYCIQWAIKKRINIPWLDWAVENGLASTVKSSNSQDAPPRSRRDFLAITNVLVGALIDKRTEEPYKDAVVTCQLLASKGIELPISEKTLGNMLSEYDKSQINE
jgi:hypothetical protein